MLKFLLLVLFFYICVVFLTASLILLRTLVEAQIHHVRYNALRGSYAGASYESQMLGTVRAWAMGQDEIGMLGANGSKGDGPPKEQGVVNSGTINSFEDFSRAVSASYGGDKDNDVDDKKLQNGAVTGNDPVKTHAAAASSAEKTPYVFVGKCNICQEEGHKAKQCPKGAAGRSKGGSRYQRDAKAFSEELKRMEDLEGAAHDALDARAAVFREEVRDQRERIQELEKQLKNKKTKSAIPEDLLNSSGSFEKLKNSFDDLPTIKTVGPNWPAILQFWLIVVIYAMGMHFLGAYSKHWLSFGVILTCVATMFIVIVMRDLRMYTYTSRATKRYTLLPGQADDVADNRDISTRGRDPIKHAQYRVLRIEHLKRGKTVNWPFFWDVIDHDQLPYDTVMCDSVSGAPRVEEWSVSLALFDALRNPKVVTSAVDAKNALALINRFAATMDLILLDTRVESVDGLRSATAELAYGWTYGFERFSSTKLTHNHLPSRVKDCFGNELTKS